MKEFGPWDKCVGIHTIIIVKYRDMYYVIMSRSSLAESQNWCLLDTRMNTLAQ